MILMEPTKLHIYDNATLAERDRIAAAFEDGGVQGLATILLQKVVRNLYAAGVNGWIYAAIDMAARGVTSNGAAQGVKQVRPADVARALEVLIGAAEDEHGATVSRAEQHREALQATQAEWAQLLESVAARHDAAEADLAQVIERQEALRDGEAVDDIAERSLADQQQALEECAKNLKGRIDRYLAFDTDPRENFWVVYDCDSVLDALLESVAERLGIAAPETPIEVPA